MKTIVIALAGFAAAAGAQTVVTHTTTRTTTDTRPAIAVHRTRRVCTVRYRHHQRIRTCRAVRY